MIILGMIVGVGICGLSAAAVGGGRGTPPDILIEFGIWRVIGRTSVIPLCSQLINPGCVLVDPVPPRRIYTLWLLTRAGATWENPELIRLATIEIDSP
jgi:hypothetical protein